MEKKPIKNTVIDNVSVIPLKNKTKPNIVVKILKEINKGHGLTLTK